MLEGGRGGIELLQNLMTVGLYTLMGYSLFGLELAFKINAVVMIVLGIAAWFVLPKETLLKAGGDKSKANQEVLLGMKTTLRLPEVWMAGVVGFTIYFAYTSMPFFLTYLKDLHALPALAIAAFGIISTSGGRIGMALPAGFIAQRFFGGATGGMAAGLALVCVCALIMAVLPSEEQFTWPAMIMMAVLALLFFFMRALYFAPFGEMGLPQRFSGSVIAIAAFLIYLPSSFAYLLWGYLLDANPGLAGYQYMFAVLGLVAIVGVVVGQILKRRIQSGVGARINLRIQALDAELGLSGDEKTLSGLIDESQPENK